MTVTLEKIFWADLRSHTCFWKLKIIYSNALAAYLFQFFYYCLNSDIHPATAASLNLVSVMNRAIIVKFRYKLKIFWLLTMTDYSVLHYWPLKCKKMLRYNARTLDANSNSILIRSPSTSLSTACIKLLNVREKTATTKTIFIKYTSMRFSARFSNFTAERAMEPTALIYLSIAVWSAETATTGTCSHLNKLTSKVKESQQRRRYFATTCDLWTVRYISIVWYSSEN